MRNLKRALSLVMAMALIVGMMVISASAVSVKDFTDSDEIDHNEAVNTMVALNVISGKDDGSYFDPDGTLTRAEMAKVVAFVMNGGVEPNIGTKVIPTYSDIDNHWAEAYIEYCTSMGIIAGDGQGKFNPTGELTASQTAKMFLTAMGYNASVFGLVGADWETNTNRFANEAGLYENLGDIRVSDPISRDDMAQMAYNAIQAAIMERSWSQDITTGTITEGYSLALSDEGKPERTLFSERFGGVIYEGVLLGSGSMGPIENHGAGKDRLRIDAEYRNGNEVNSVYTLNYATDCTDLIGEYVKVLYDETGKDTYGVYSVQDETTVVINTTVGAVGSVNDPANTLTVDDVTYDVDPGALAYVITSDTVWSSVSLMGIDSDNRVANYDDIKLVDNDGDGILDVAIVVTNNIEQVTYVGTDAFTLTSKGSVKNADAIYSDLAVDDIVSYTYKNANYNGKYVITKADTLTGEVTEVGYASDGTTVNRVLVDGTWYNLGLDDVSGTAYEQDDTGTPLDYKTTYDMAIYNGYVVDADKVVGSNYKVAVVTGTTNTLDFDGNELTRLLLADGTSVEVYVDDSGLTKGEFIVYTIEDNIYKVADAADDSEATRAGYKHYGSGSGVNVLNPADTDGKILDGTYKINKDAVVFIQYDSDLSTPTLDKAFRVTNGAEINSWKSAYGTSYEVLWNDAGLGFVDVVYITGAGGVATPGTVSNYGYITSAITEGSDASGVYSAFTMWDGSDTVSVIIRSNSLPAGVTKGAVITFDWDGTNEIKNVSAISDTAALIYSNGEQVRLNNNGYDLADDVTIINVDTKNAAGVGGNAISTAAQGKTPGVYYQNCWYVVNDNEITLLVIDVTNNRLSGTTYDTNGWDANSNTPGNPSV